MSQMSKSPLASNFYPAHESNFTYGRSGRKIEMICIHHMAGRLTSKQCGAIFQTVGRGGSSHYGIGYNGDIACYVDEQNTAWTNSNWDSNCKSVTIETSDNDNSWYVNDTTLNSLIKLVADIGRRNNLGKLIKGKNVTWHSMYANTTCPGDYLRSKIQYICDEANKINDSYNLKYEKIDRKSIKLKLNTSLWDLHFTSYNNAKSIKKYNKGDVIDNIVAIVKHPIGSTYYITEYSYKNNIMNGFNVKDCEDIVKEEPKVDPPKAEPPKEEPKKEEPKEEPKKEEVTPNPIPKEPEITENFIKRFFRALIDLIKKWLSL